MSKHQRVRFSSVYVITLAGLGSVFVLASLHNQQLNGDSTKDLLVESPKKAQNDAKAESNKLDSVIACPQYVWMHHGSYCSYYALEEDTCAPLNLDSTNCMLPQGTCGAMPANCIASFRDGDPGADGYPGDIATVQLKYPANPSPAQFDITFLKSIVVKFRDANSHIIYAQIFAAYVVPKFVPGCAQYLAPPAIISRGIEIKEPIDIDVDYDFSIEPARNPIKPSAGRGHCYIYKSGSISVDIITHRHTPPHNLK